MSSGATSIVLEEEKCIRSHGASSVRCEERGRNAGRVDSRRVGEGLSPLRMELSGMKCLVVIHEKLPVLRVVWSQLGFWKVTLVAEDMRELRAEAAGKELGVRVTSGSFNGVQAAGQKGSI